MKNLETLILVSLGLVLVTVPALAGDFLVRVPEPMSLSLLAGGVLAIAVVKRARGK